MTDMNLFLQSVFEKKIISESIVKSIKMDEVILQNFTGHYGRLCYLRHNIHGISPHGARHVIETAAHAHISLSAVVEKGSLEH